MKNIAILVYDISLFGGAERVAVNLANELCHEYNVNLISCFNSKNRESFQLNERVKKHILTNNTVSMTLNCLKLSKLLKKILIENNIDVILNITAGVNTISYFATKKINTKVIYCEHSNLVNKTYGKKHEFRQWIGAKTADKVIALTEVDKKEFDRKYGIEGKTDYIYNWYDGSVYYDYDTNNKKIISVGRLEYVKGYDRMVKVAEKVLKKHTDWVWDIYGEGTYRDNIQKLIDEYGLENNMFLKGNDPNVIEKYKYYSLSVMTSYYEGFALALVEAMANSLPTISFDCPTGPSEIITSGVNGFLIEDGNIDEMANKINELIENESLRLSFSHHTVDVLPKFNKGDITKKWIKTINELD